MRIEEDMKLDFKDVLIRPKRSTLGSRKEVNLHRRYIFRNYIPKTNFHESESENHYHAIPIMASNMDGVGTFSMADTLGAQGLFTCLVKTYSPQELIEFFETKEAKLKAMRRDYTAYSMGITEKDREKFHIVYQQASDIKYVCIDVANGYSERFAQFVKDFRTAYPHIVIIAGNVVTGEMTEELILCGADIIKVGIGPGSVCTTRLVTGVGYPQLSALIECADAAHGLGGHIIADGGCTSSGDIAKAFAGGADYVMLGGMLAGHDEGGGEVITRYFKSNEMQLKMTPSHDTDKAEDAISENDFEPVIEEKKFVQFYGMSSKSANDKHFDGLKGYRSSEGRTVLVPYKGGVKQTVQDVLGGIRSTCTYAGAVKLKHLSRCTTFVRCTQTHNAIYENVTIGK